MNAASRASELASNKHVLMIGPAPEGRGGMASVAAAYRDGGVFSRWDVVFIDTLSTGGVGAKLVLALWAWLRLFALLLRARAGLLHVHMASGVSFWRKAMFCWTAYLFRVPVLIHLHGGNFVDFYRQRSRIGQCFMRATLSRAARVIVLSEAWINRLACVVPAEQCIALENPVSPWPRPARSPNAGEQGLSFLFLGRLERDKGVEELLRAFSICRQSGLQARLKLGGDGDAVATMALAQSLGVADEVELLGWIAGAKKQQALSDADVFILPSHIEGLPVAMLEAMYCALPIVICPVGSIPEVLTNTADALFVPIKDEESLAQAMLKLAHDSSLRTRLGLQAEVQFHRRFSMDSIGPRLDALYRSSLAYRKPFGRS